MSDEKKVKQILADLNRSVGVPPYKKEDLNQCCGQQAPSTKKVIDLSRPLEAVGNPQLQVRLLTQHYKAKNTVEGALVSVFGGGPNHQYDRLYLLDPVSGHGIGIDDSASVAFRNTPVVKEQTFYLNYYGNPEPDHSVVEGYDTRKEADENNIFYARDCCVKVTVKSTDGVWSACAIVEAQ